jgi:hypothetical protein
MADQELENPEQDLGAPQQTTAERKMELMLEQAQEFQQEAKRYMDRALRKAPESEQTTIYFLKRGETHSLETTAWMVKWLDDLDKANKDRKTKYTAAEIELKFYKEASMRDTDAEVIEAVSLRMNYLELAGTHGWKPAQALLKLEVDINDIMAVYNNLALLRTAQPDLFKTKQKTYPNKGNKYKGGKGGRGRGKGGYNNNYYQAPYQQGNAAAPQPSGATPPARR